MAGVGVGGGDGVNSRSSVGVGLALKRKSSGTEVGTGESTVIADVLSMPEEVSYTE